MLTLYTAFLGTLVRGSKRVPVKRGNLIWYTILIIQVMDLDDSAAGKIPPAHFFQFNLQNPLLFNFLMSFLTKKLDEKLLRLNNVL